MLLRPPRGPLHPVVLQQVPDRRQVLRDELPSSPPPSSRLQVAVLDRYLRVLQVEVMPSAEQLPQPSTWLQHSMCPVGLAPAGHEPPDLAA